MGLASLLKKSIFVSSLLLTTQLFFPNLTNGEIPSKWTRISEPTRTIELGRRKFNASLLRTKDKPHNIGWYIIEDNGDVIGDNTSEANLYGELIKVATISRYVSNSREINSVLDSHINSFRKSFYAISATELAIITRNVGSDIEGRIARLVLEGHEFKDISFEIYKEIRNNIRDEFIRDRTIIQSVQDISDRLKNDFTITTLRGISKSIKQLEMAKKIANENKTWSYNEAVNFYAFYKVGLLSGVKYMEIWNNVKSLDNKGWKKHASSIAESFRGGFKGENFTRLFRNAYGEYLPLMPKINLKDKFELFEPIDRLYYTKECSGNIILLTDFLYPSNRDKEAKRILEKDINESGVTLFMPVKYLNLDCHTDQEAIVITKGASHSGYEGSVWVSSILNIFRLRNNLIQKIRPVYRIDIDRSLVSVSNINDLRNLKNLETKIELKDLTRDNIPEIIVESESQGSEGYTNFLVIGFKKNNFDILFNLKDVAGGRSYVTNKGLVISKEYPRGNIIDTLYSWNEEEKKFKVADIRKR